jgi:hypothetical protein
LLSDQKGSAGQPAAACQASDALVKKNVAGPWSLVIQSSPVGAAGAYRTCRYIGT